jgi:hypothetical protein
MEADATDATEVVSGFRPPGSSMAIGLMLLLGPTLTRLGDDG